MSGINEIRETAKSWDNSTRKSFDEVAMFAIYVVAISAALFMLITVSRIWPALNEGASEGSTPMPGSAGFWMSIYLLILALLIYFQGIKPARYLFKTQAFGGQNVKGIFRIAHSVLVPSLLFACFISVVAIGFDAAETASQGRRPLFEVLNISLLAVLFSGGAALQYAARKAAYESLGLTLTAPPPWQRLKKKINKSR